MHHQRVSLVPQDAEIVVDGKKSKRGVIHATHAVILEK